MIRSPRRLGAGLVGGLAVAVLLADVVATTVVGATHRGVPSYADGPGVTVVDTAGGFTARFPHAARQVSEPLSADGVTATIYVAADETDLVAAEVVVTTAPLDADDAEQALRTGIEGIGEEGGLTLQGSSSGRFRGDPAVVGTYASARGQLRAVAFFARGEVCLLLAPVADFGVLAASFQLTGSGPGSTDA